MENSETVDRTIRNHRHQMWPAVVVFVVFCFSCLMIAGLLLRWLHPNWVRVVFAGSIIFGLPLLGIVLRRLPHSVARVKLGALLQTFPGGLAHPPSMISDISFGPDPAEDYAESPLPVRMCQATIALLNGRRFQLIVSAGDAIRLHEWATKKGITVSDSDGYSSRADVGLPAPVPSDPSARQDVADEGHRSPI
jgi:hypothetical protein